MVQPGGRLASLEFGASPTRRSGALWSALHADAPAGGRLRARRPRVVARRPLPRAEHRGPLRALAPRSPARALARGGDERRARAAHEPRRRGRDLGHARWRLTRPARAARRPGLLRAAPRGLARPGDDPPPALHALAPELRGARRGGGPGDPRRPARGGARGLLPGGRPERARARRASWATARHPPERPRAGRDRGGRPRRRRRHRHRRLLHRLARRCCRWWCSAPSSCPPTTSSSPAAASTPTSGSRQHGGPSPPSSAGGRTPSGSIRPARPLPRWRSSVPASGSASRSGASRRRCASYAGGRPR